jgi:hypothetical protein
LKSKNFSQLADEILIKKQPLLESAGGISYLITTSLMKLSTLICKNDGINFINNKSSLLLSQQDEIESNESENLISGSSVGRFTIRRDEFRRK